MALFLLNSSEPPADLAESLPHRTIRQSSISRLLSYTMIFSPRYDEFVILSDMPDHIIQSARMPGLRRNRVDGEQHSLLLDHVPTSARVRFCPWNSHNASHQRDLKVYPLHFDEMSDEWALRGAERAVVDAVPEIHHDSEVLLAGLLSRLWLSSKREGWAVSGLTSDALRRWEKHDHEYGDEFVYLWGSDSDWVLRWGGLGSVPAVDVARALTHEVVGIDGAHALHRGVDRSEVRLGRARLVLETVSPPNDMRHPAGGGR
ncbi:hypothetical protein [Nocardia salmonicida]|uniref:hypothetical protein n=1 Tax=Nocardia salmonicida TaxID=53431 RepID=UPI0033DCC52D